jgi:hypothetical protein
MTTTKTLQALLIGALLASSAAFADTSIQIDVVAGKQQAKFSIGDAKCVLVDEQIKCMPVVMIAAN